MVGNLSSITTSTHFPNLQNCENEHKYKNLKQNISDINQSAKVICKEYVWVEYLP